MKKIILIFVWGLVFCDCYGQNQCPLAKQWDYRFGGTDEDLITSFLQTSDGGYILGGYSLSNISGDKTQACWGLLYDYWIVKIDSSCNKQWDKDFGGLSSDYFSALQQTDDGGYILGGFSWSDSSGDKSQNTWGYSDYWIVKIDSLGNKQWDKDFGGTNYEELYSLQQTTDGGYILGGHSDSGISGDKTQPTQGHYDYWIVKTDSLGNKQWDKNFGGIADDQLYSIQQTPDGGYILAGYSLSGISGDKSQPTWGNWDYWIVKTDSLGNKQWDKDFGGTDGDLFQSLQFTPDGGFILGGNSYSGINGDKTQDTWGSADYWVVKIDSLGNKLWDKDFGGTDNEDAFGNISQTKDNGYLLCGTSYSNISGDKTENNLGLEQIWVVKTDSIGIKQWDKTIFTTNHDELGLGFQTKDDCYTFINQTYAGIGGYKSQPNWGSWDYWIIKFCDSTLTTSISNLQSPTSTFQIFPNPTTNTIQLTINTKHNAPLHCEIINVMGERVLTSPLTPLQMRGESYAMLDISFLSKGIYLVRVGDGKSFENRKLVIE